MALRHFDGLEQYAVGAGAAATLMDRDPAVGSEVALASISSTVVYTGTRSLLVEQSSLGQPRRLTVFFRNGGMFAQGDTLIVGGWVRITTTGRPTSLPFGAQQFSTGRAAMLLLENVSGNVRVGWATANANGATTALETIRWTGALDLPTGWHHIEAKVLLRGDATGTVDVRVDGATWESTTGIVTLHNAADVLDTWASAATDWATPATNARYVDDVYVCDGTGSAPFNDFLGPVRVTWLPPVADAQAQWVPSSGSSNFAMVDEQNSSGADYVDANVENAEDRYRLDPLPSLRIPLAVMVLRDALSPAVGAAPIRHGLRLDGVSSLTVSELAPASAQFSTLVMTQAPGAVPWTRARVNTSQLVLRRDG
jgi:hypothetical protein